MSQSRRRADPHVLREALLGIGVGALVHAAITALPACLASFASPLLLIGALLVILAPALFLRGPWPRRVAFVAAYATALLIAGLPDPLHPWGLS